MGTNGIRIILLIEGMLFIAASLVHFGVLTSGYEHQKAGTAETVIGLVLFGGLIVSLLRPIWTRVSGLVVEGFALLGTLVGIITIAIGVGPRTLPDIIFHICIVSILVVGLIVTVRSPTAVGGSESLAR